MLKQLINIAVATILNFIHNMLEYLCTKFHVITIIQSEITEGRAQCEQDAQSINDKNNFYKTHTFCRFVTHAVSYRYVINCHITMVR